MNTIEVSTAAGNTNKRRSHERFSAFSAVILQLTRRILRRLKILKLFEQ